MSSLPSDTFLIIEWIDSLNPDLLKHLESGDIILIYVSVLTPLNIDF